MALRFYTDSALTETAFDIPIGSARWLYPLSRLSTFTVGGETYYYHASHWSSGWSDFEDVNGNGVDVTGINYRTNLYTDGLQVTELYDQTPPANMIIGSWYSHGTVLNTSSGSQYRNLIAIRFNCEGVAMFAIGSTYDSGGRHQFGAAVIFSENCLGGKAFTRPYMDESSGLNDGNGESWGGTGVNDRTSDNVGASPYIKGVAPFNLTGGRGQHVYILDGTSFDTFTGYLWGTDTSLFGSLWSKWQNLKFNPIGAILGCHCLPSAFIPIGTDVSSIYLAGTTLTPMPSAPAICRAVTPDNGHIMRYPADGVPVFRDVAALIDFTDFTGVSVVVHVPFCGSCTIPISACMGGVGDDLQYHPGGIAVTYYCDILTGNVCAYVYARDRNGREQIIQTLTGNCAYQIPITGNDNGAGQFLGAVTSTAIGALMGNPGAVFTGAVGMATPQHNTNIIGNHGGSAAILTNLYTWAEFTYNEYSRPANTNPTRGRPSDIGGTVNAGAGVEYSGFTVFDSVDVHEISTLVATDAEKSEIETLLTSGVYL